MQPEMITSKSQELEMRIKWLENGLKEIANGRDDINAIYVKQQAQSILDGEPTTADEVNKDKCPIPGSRDYWEPTVSISDEHNDVLNSTEGRGDYRDGEPAFGGDTGIDEVNKDECPIPGSRDYWEPKDKNVVLISDVNKEIAKEWKRENSP